MTIGTTLKSGIAPDFHIPTEIYIKQDSLSEIGAIVKKYGSRVVLVTSLSDFAQFQESIELITTSIIQSDCGCIIYDEIPPNADTEYIDSAVHFTKKTNCDIILGFGGMDSLNAAKAISILTNNYLFCEDLFSQPDIKPPVTLITVPAYPVFGFEILPMFYLTEIHEMQKKVYASPYLHPRATIIDAKVSGSISDETTATSAISTLAMATDSVISKVSNTLINTYALKSIDLIFKNLPLAFRDPQNISSRMQLSIASVMAGMAFSVSELSVSLAVALALSSRASISVEMAMGVILPHVMEYNLTASPGKFVQMSKVMDENVKDITVIEAAIKAVEGVRKLEMDVDIPQRLSQFEISKTEFAPIAETAFTYPFIANAPRPLTKDEIETILIAAF